MNFKNKEQIELKTLIGGIFIFLGIFGGVISASLPTIFELDVDTRFITLFFGILIFIGGLILIFGGIKSK